MKITRKSRAGKSTGPVLFILALCIAMGAIYFFVIKKPEAAKPEPAVEVKEEPKPVAEPEPKPEPKIVVKEEPKPEPKPEPKVVEEPKVEEKSEVDLFLEKKFPFAEFAPLEELMKGWKEVPTDVYPAEITVHASRRYSDKSGKKSEFISEGHKAKPVKLLGSILTVKSVDYPTLSCRVGIDKTNFKELVQQAYEEKIEQKNQEVIAAREAFRPTAIAYLANAKSSERPVAKVAKQEKRRKVSDFDAKKYGRKFRDDYWGEGRNGKNDKVEHDVPMGALSGVAAVLYNKSAARITQLWEDGPGALAGLQVGDVITKINGKGFPEYSNSNYDGGIGFPKELGDALIKAQASGDPLGLTVTRGEEELEISVDALPEIPDFTDTFPADCPRSEAMATAAADYLYEHISDATGQLRANDYTNAWYGLSLLATGDEKNLRIVKKLARFYGEKYDLGKNPSAEELISGNEEKGLGSRGNWFVSTIGMFLGEYYLATGDESVLPAFGHCCRSMEARLHPENGRFGHNRGMEELPYDGKGLVIINVHAHIMWALEAQIKGIDDYNWEKWELSYKSVQAAIGGDGSVGYNFSARGGSQGSPRTGAMAIALTLTGKEKKTLRGFGKWLNEYHKTFPDVHAMSFIGPIFGFSGLKNINEKHYRKVMDEYKWMYSITLPPNFKHGSYYYGDRGNTGGDEYCNKRFVANIMTLYLMNSHRSDTLWMLGNRKKNWAK